MTKYLTRLWDALRGRDDSPAWHGTLDSGGQSLSPSSSGDQPTTQPNIAALQFELRERDELIERLKHEYDSLQRAKQQSTQTAGNEQLERLFKRLAGPLANLSALTSMSEAGQDVVAADLTQLVRAVEGELSRGGLERIGVVGQAAGFDVALHQRMSGGDVHPGSSVTVQIPGYRFEHKVLMKALVTAAPDKPRESIDG